MLKRLVDWVGASLLLVLVWLRLRLSDRATDRLARVVAALAPFAVPSRHRVAVRNLKRAFGASKTREERARILRESYLHGVTAFFDLLPLFRMTREAWLTRVEFTGEEHLRAALARGKGVIVVSAHYGAFPALGAAIPSLGVHLALLYRKPKSPKTRKLFDDWLDRTGCEIIEDTPRHLAGLRCLEALGRGACLGILIDQHFPAGIDVPFFGAPARTGVGAALLAVRSGAPFVPIRILRTAPGRYRVAIEPVIEPPAGRSREALAACTAALTARVEAWIREEPGHWFWIHRRWKELDRIEDSHTQTRG